jgi:hypothetical protein
MSMFFACSSVSGSRALSVEYLSLGEILAQSETVARVRIVAREPIEFEYEGKVHECGHLYSAEVVESMKGRAHPFRFHLEEDADFGGFDVEHFVIVQRRNQERALDRLTPLFESLTGLERERIRCSLSIEYFVHDPRQALLPFDSSAAQQFGGKWLRQNRGSVISRIDFDHREIGKGEEAYMVFSWDDVKSAVQDLIREPGATHP